MSILRNIFLDSETSKIRPFWRGQLFLFDKPPTPAYTSLEGTKLLLVFLFLEAIARPLLNVGAQALGIAERNWWSLAQVIILIVLVCWLVPNFTKLHLSQLGLYAWSRWSKTEKFYLLQTLPLAIIIFSIFNFSILKMVWTQPNLREIGVFIFMEKMIWGYYQEIVYRGVLQTELVQRWGTRRGILASNLIFTFGPLHAYHFLLAQGNPSHLWIFAAIFAIGLFFAILFRRSGNLWIIGILHGVGDWFIDGLAQVSKMTS